MYIYYSQYNIYNLYILYMYIYIILYQKRQETRGQWQKCYGKAFMSIYLLKE